MNSTLALLVSHISLSDLSMYIFLYTYKVYTFKKLILRKIKETSSIYTVQETLQMDVNTS